MRMTKSIVAVTAVLAACVSSAEAATGSSAWFPVDTTDNTLKISDVTSKYFDGEYGGKTGRKATFLNGTSCEIEMKVLMDDYSEVDHWLVNGREVTARTFTVDVGTIAVGGKLEVVAIGKKNGVRSKAYRVNFDIAKHVDEEHAGIWTARPSNSGGIDEIRYTPFGAPSVSFPFAPEKGGELPKQLKWLPGDGWALSPKIELKLEARSGGNGSFTLGTIGVGLSATGSVEKASHKRIHRGMGTLARVMDKDVGITFTGGPLTMSWNAQKGKWVAEDVSFGGEVNGSFGWTHHYPTPIGPVFLEGKIEAALAGTFKVSGFDAGWGGLESSFTLNSERLPKGTVAGGYGINNVANVKGSISVMSVLEATHSKGAWTDCRWGLRGSGALTAKFLPFEATLFEMTSETFWIINNSSPKSMRLMSGASSADLDWHLQSRDYLKNAKANLRLKSGEVGEGIAVVEAGGYPDPAPAMASGVKGDALAYLRDNESRSSANRTELVLRMGTSNEWNTAEVVWDDGTADFMPSLAAMPDGSIAAAWMNASRTFSDSVAVGEFSAAMEIAVGVRNATTGAWTCRNLTADGAFDFSPVVRAASNGKVLVAWLRNASGAVVSSALEPTDIMAAVYSGGTWGSATVVRSGVGVVHGFDVAFDGDRAVLAFSKDADGDSSTTGDAETYAIRMDGGTWGDPIRLTAAGDADGIPLVRTDGGGEFAVLWTAKGALMETRELALSNAVVVAAADGWTLPANPTMIRGADGRDALLWNGASEDGGAADAPTAMMYDPVCGAWGSPVKLFDDGRKESRISGAVGMDGGLRIGYESASVATNEAGEVSFGATELRTRFIPAVCDLAVSDDAFSFSTDEFVLGENVLLTVKAANLGFRTATNVTVKVYEENGESKTELASVITNFAGGGHVALSVPWKVDNTQSNLLFSVEVDAGENEESEDAQGNNSFVWSAGEPDVSFGAVSERNESATRRLLTAAVSNAGLGPLPAGGRVVFRRGGENGEVLAVDEIGTVWSGTNGVYNAGLAWDMEGVTFTSAWETVCVQLFSDETAEEAADMSFVQVMTALDSDGDGLLDAQELQLGTDPFSVDGDVKTARAIFEANGGTVEEMERRVRQGDVIGTLPTPTRTMYTFLGWFTETDGGNEVTAETVVTADMILYAHWLCSFALDVDNWIQKSDGSWQSGATGNSATNSISITVRGAGTVMFKWKVSCEDYFVFRTNKILLDYLSFLVDGNVRDYINGETDWTDCTFAVEGMGEHVLTWAYIKDSEGTDGEDCAWLDAVVWSPAGVSVDVGGGKLVTVPQTWIDEHPEIVAAADGNVAAALGARAANGRLSVAECYVLGLDPENETNDFKIVSFPMKADGTPDWEHIAYEPKNEKWNVVGARAVLKGAESLGGDWHEVDKTSEADRAKYRFYKVVVELP